MVIYGITRKEYTLLLKKENNASCGVTGKFIDFQCLSSEIKYIALFYRLKRRHLKAVLLAHLNKLRRIDKQVSKIKILRVHVCFIEIYVAQNMVAVTVSVDHDYRLISKTSYIALDVAKSAHRVDYTYLVIALNHISCGAVTFIEKVQPGLKLSYI